MSYDNTNSGVLFKNDKGDNPKRPDYRGSLNVGGTDYNVSGWVRKSQKSGDSFLSLKVEPKKDVSGPKKVQPKQQLTSENWATAELNDDMPF